MRKLVLLIVVAAVIQSPARAADAITIVGSSTVYPFSSLVAEHFAKSGPFPAPSVRSTSTAEGFKLFCSGTAADTPDISNASRRISQPETQECLDKGVRNFTEIRIGYDSLILANALKAGTFNITLNQLWRAAADLVPIKGRLIPNPYRTWQDIDPALPPRPIKILGPAPGHGTRDAFVELVMEPSCKAALSQVSNGVESTSRACTAVRRDGAWTDVDNLELILGKLASNPDAMGVLSYSYLEQFANRIHAATVNDIAPSRATIPSGTYPLSRPLFIYVKDAHLKARLGLADYAAEFLSFCAAGAHGYLADEGLVPLPTPELLAQRAVVARLQR
ncbi:MAG: substrate-binding domain-containing protein [Proteobacteria bacterium]|nr:substrate-binding domain-containing protein [Pseudomonadota bacterium]